MEALMNADIRALQVALFDYGGVVADHYAQPFLDMLAKFGKR